jgi:hypothetical protein
VDATAPAGPGRTSNTRTHVSANPAASHPPSCDKAMHMQNFERPSWAATSHFAGVAAPLLVAAARGGVAAGYGNRHNDRVWDVFGDDPASAQAVSLTSSPDVGVSIDTGGGQRRIAPRLLALAPARIATQLPPLRSHSRSDWSAPAESAVAAPCTERASTHPACPCSTWRRRGAPPMMLLPCRGTSHTCSVVSPEPLTSVSPSSVSAKHVTHDVCFPRQIPRP